MPPFPPNSGQGGPGQGGPGRQGPGGGGQGGYAPPGSYPQPAYGAGSGPGPGPGSGGRYPPSGYGGPNHGHGGGGHGGHGGHGLPRPPTLPNTPRPGVGAGAAAGGPPRRAGEDVKTTKIFVGSIAPGITDRTLRDLLNVSCGAELRSCSTDALYGLSLTLPRHAVHCTSSSASRAQGASRRRSGSRRSRAPRTCCAASGA